MPCEAEQTALKTKIDALKKDFQTKVQKISDDAREGAKDIDPDINTKDPLIYVGMNFEIRWRRVDWSMDLPVVWMEDQKIAFDLPSITMKTREISFDLPSVRMERREGPPYPEFRCNNPFDCTVTWSKTYIDVPVPFPERHVIKMDLPEVTMVRNEIVLGIPQVKMETQKFSFDVPEFVLKDVKVEAAEAKQKGEQLAAKTNGAVANAKSEFSAQAKQQTGSEFSAFIDCQTAELTKKISEGLNSFDQAANQIRGFIAGLESQKVPKDNVQYLSLSKNLADTLKTREEFDKKMKDQLGALPKLHERFVQQLLGQPPR